MELCAFCDVLLLKPENMVSIHVERTRRMSYVLACIREERQFSITVELSS